jgi:DUF4097 and DUF4098 domain-containing protein YvlB
MRRRGSVTGPLILIAIGVLFLLHTILPDFRVTDILAHDWPYFLIIWGILQLAEVLVRASRGAAVQGSGISGGGWMIVVFICLIGLASWEFSRSDAWWRHVGFEKGMQVFGSAHDYSIPFVQKTVGTAPHVVIENFRGNAKISASDGSAITVNGRKTVRTFDSAEADRANLQSPIEVMVEGKNVIIRCNQEKVGPRDQVTTDLELTIPKGSSIEATGRLGDFDISGIAGTVDLSSDNAGIRLQYIGGNIKIDTRRSDEIRLSNIKGAVSLNGRGGDVDLTNIAGQVTVAGDYNGTISLHDVSKPVRVESLRTKIEAEAVPGELTLARGSLDVTNVVGPLKVVTQSTDVTLNDFAQALDLTVDRGDVELKPGRTPLSKMTVHLHSGNIELAVPQKAGFALSATTDHGDIENDFGDGLKEQSSGRGGRLEGTVGSGPDVTLATDRGTITVRKSGSEDKPKKPVPEDSEAHSDI